VLATEMPEDVKDVLMKVSGSWNAQYDLPVRTFSSSRWFSSEKTACDLLDNPEDVKARLIDRKRHCKQERREKIARVLAFLSDQACIESLRLFLGVVRAAHSMYLRVQSRDFSLAQLPELVEEVRSLGVFSEVTIEHYLSPLLQLPAVDALTLLSPLRVREIPSYTLIQLRASAVVDVFPFTSRELVSEFILLVRNAWDYEAMISIRDFVPFCRSFCKVRAGGHQLMTALLIEPTTLDQERTLSITRAINSVRRSQMSIELMNDYVVTASNAKGTVGGDSGVEM
jgi:hypothetical protein